MKNNDCRIKISTIMPVYNSEEWIKETIDSWLAQTISEKELICVDDCSTDNSRQIIKDYAEKNSLSAEQSAFLGEMMASGAK